MRINSHLNLKFEQYIRCLSLFFLLLFAGFSADAQAPFLTTWQTDNTGTSNNTSITIPTNPSYTYSYDVDWENDGTFDDIGVTGNITHDYGTAGSYQVAIRGTFPAIYFNNAGEHQKITSIDQWGDIAWATMTRAFYSCIYLEYTATDLPDLSAVSDMSFMFRNAASFNGDLSAWDVANVTTMGSTFYGAASFNGDLSAWDVSSVVDMYGMFWDAASFNQDLSAWNVANVTGMFRMFSAATSFNQDLSAWNVSNVNNMNGMFGGASSFDQDLGSWNVGGVVYFDFMLENCGMSTANYDNTLVGWSNQAVMTNRSLGAAGLTYCDGEAARNSLINTHGWTITNDALECLPNYFLTTWQTDNPGASNSTSITIPTWANLPPYNYDVDWENDGIFDDLGVMGNITHDYGTAGSYQVAIRGTFPSIFFNNEGDKDKITSIDQWGDIAWTSMFRSFYGCTNLGYTATDAPDLSAVTRLERMFSDATSFNGDVSDWDVSSIDNMNGMFGNATSFDQDLGGWNVGGVVYFIFMLDDCGMSTTNYDNTLIGWSNQAVMANRSLGAAGLTYCDGETARNSLINTYGWTITGDALGCPFVCEAPTNTQINITTSTTATVTWDAVVGATNYQVKYRIKGTSNWTTTSSSSLQRNLTNLTKTKYYQYKVRTNCDGEWSDFSAIEIFYTSICDIIPTGIASIYLDNTRMRIRWDNIDEVKAKVRYREVGTSMWYTQNSADGNNYVYINDLTPNATYQYRVRSNCEANDWSAYSGSYFHNLSIPRLAANESSTQIRVYPNPVNDILNVEFEIGADKDINIMVFDQLGKVVHTMNGSYLKGSQKESIDMSSFANGYYFIRLQGDDLMQTFKFVKVR
jgi:surface protein